MARRTAILISAAVLFCCGARLSSQARVRHLHPEAGIVAFDLNGPVPLRLVELGTGLVRGSCPWPNVEPARGVFDWTCTDNVILGADRLGMRSYMTISCTPGWANDGRGCRNLPDDLTDWYAFVANFVARYAGLQTVLSVWNEPNLELNDDVSGKNYALLFINASRARNAVAPKFALAGPETSHHALLNGYLANTFDAIQSFDAFDAQDILSVHWYPDGPPLTDYLDTVHAIGGNRDTWLTETGEHSTEPEDQATFYQTVLETFAASGRPWWTHVIFYRLWDGTDCCSESILRGDYSFKPAFRAYRDWLLQPRAVPRPVP